MLFNSLAFAVFLSIVFLLYWFVFQRNLKGQNLFVVAASYFFYGWWDWHFLFLIIFTTLCSYGAGILMEKCKDAPRNARLCKDSISEDRLHFKRDCIPSDYYKLL